MSHVANSRPAPPLRSHTQDQVTQQTWDPYAYCIPFPKNTMILIIRSAPKAEVSAALDKQAAGALGGEPSGKEMSTLLNAFCCLSGCCDFTLRIVIVESLENHY